jgi:hypothetical protein
MPHIACADIFTNRKLVTAEILKDNSLISVVFPDPFSPTSARLSPGRICRLMLVSALWLEPA